MLENLIKQKLNELNSIVPHKDHTYIPVSIILEEAENLSDVCQKDKKALERARLDWKIVLDLPVRIGALKVCQDKWESDYKNLNEWKTKRASAVDEALDLRGKLVHSLLFGLALNKAEHSKVQLFSKGTSTADLISSLLKLAEIGKKHDRELMTSGFDMYLLDQSLIKALDLSDLLIKANSAFKETKKSRLLRNKAYDHLKEALNKIRRVGQWQFLFNDDKNEVYKSQYIKRLNEARRKKLDQIEASDANISGKDPD